MRKSLSALLLLLVATSSLAQNPVIWSGGIGVAERASAPATGTKFVFFVRSGEFLSHVQVSITDASGREVVNILCKGPWLIVDLAPGTYQVTASTVNHSARTLEVVIPAGESEIGFMFME